MYIIYKNGFAGTSTRDIAKNIGVNHALITYYFKNKKKLFEEVMFKISSKFMKKMFVIFNDEKTTLEDKIELCVSQYIDLLIKNPDIINFVIIQINSHPIFFEEQGQYGALLKNSVIIKQIDQAITEGKIRAESPRIFLFGLSPHFSFKKKLNSEQSEDIKNQSLRRKAV